MFRAPVALIFAPLSLVGVLPAQAPKDPLLSRELATIKKTIDAIEKGEGRPKTEGAEAIDREKGLRRLKVYRYLAGVPHEPLELDEQMNREATAASLVCSRLKRLDHDPKTNPGLPEEEFKLGQKGARSSSLGWGYRDLPEAIDSWMEDSDEGNIAAMGHRRWCINPAMARTGLGRVKEFTAMSCFDSSRKPVPDYDYISFPPRGLMPLEYFKSDWGWNVSLNPAKYAEAPKDVKVRMYLLDRDGKKPDEPLKLDFKGVDHDPFGVPNVVIFRPAKARLGAGQKYLVEIEGLTTKKDGKPAPLSFTTEFVTLK